VTPISILKLLSSECNDAFESLMKVINHMWHKYKIAPVWPFIMVVVEEEYKNVNKRAPTLINHND